MTRAGLARSASGGDDHRATILRNFNDPSIDLGGPQHMIGKVPNCGIATIMIGGFPHPVLVALENIRAGVEIEACYGAYVPQ